MTTCAEIHEGVDVNVLRPGSFIDIETKSRHYLIEFLGGNAMRISGHPEYCPTPVMAELQGSLDQRGTLELGVIRPGRRVVFLLNNENTPLQTSSVLSVHLDFDGEAKRYR
jgi:hypothetical protein